MIKYTTSEITFREVPGKINRCFSISGCGFHCKNCHSPELQGDNGEDLTTELLKKYIEKDKGIVDCYVFLGEGHDIDSLKTLLCICKESELETCVYSGKTEYEEFIKNFPLLLDYIKLGPYVEELGGLDNPKTNQRFYKIIWKEDNSAELIDITPEFWKRK